MTSGTRARPRGGLRWTRDRTRATAARWSVPPRCWWGSWLRCSVSPSWWCGPGRPAQRRQREGDDEPL